MKKIYLSPSDQWANSYPDTAVFEGKNTSEKEQMGRVADACEKALKRCGFEVINNQKSSMADRVKESNAWPADLHICIHSNACNGKVGGTRMFSYDLSGEGYKATQCIFDVLAPITPGTSENIKAYPGLYEVKNTHMPCVYVETDFHDVPEIANWIIGHVTEIGEAICQGVCNYYGVDYIADADAVVPTDDEWVKIGPFSFRVNGNQVTIKAN